MTDLPSSAASRDSLRVFFALWPEGAALDALLPWQARAHAHCGGRPMRPDTLHVTLAFLGQATHEQVAALVAHTREDRIEAGEILLSRYGTFPKQGIVHACPGLDRSDMDAHDAGTSGVDAPGMSMPGKDESETRALHALHDRLWRALETLGWQREPRPFRPHVTLLRKADCSTLPEAPADPVRWAYRHYVLVSSEPERGAAHYRILARSAEA
ncbi:2'-5' RNA ligase [Bordetella ansorpii]|uniref:RNA 2',3'-cyclic phosphodiesterase n=1 Tax=Bordetella ansorpii TaxID=288768 RepID=A0A157QV22_9BORD|nr:2'-5' RNA ligase family protein [Bordetella ansorpii]SAI49550.1 2'-5' RNA ligase [Bordetella ansorpii]